MNQAAIFDLDGTLIDSVEDIALCVNLALRELDYPIHSVEAYKKFVGEGARVMVQRALPNDAKSMTDEVIRRYRTHYKDHMLDNTKPYEGMLDLLEQLKGAGFALAVLSNKPHIFTVPMVEALFSDVPFVAIEGHQPPTPRKPDPTSVRRMIDAHAIDPERSIFVGDTWIDMKTAHAAGMRAVGVAWGFRRHAELEEAGAHLILEDPRQGFDAIKTLLDSNDSMS